MYCRVLNLNSCGAIRRRIAKLHLARSPDPEVTFSQKVKKQKWYIFNLAHLAPSATSLDRQSRLFRTHEQEPEDSDMGDLFGDDDNHWEVKRGAPDYTRSPTTRNLEQVQNRPYKLRFPGFWATRLSRKGVY